jgi:hypothetical protein
MPNNSKKRENEHAHDTGAAPSRHPAEELLILCSRTQLSAREVVRIKSLLQGPIDWDCLVKLAWKHGVTQLVYWHLAEVLPEKVPAAILATLRDTFRGVAVRNLVLGDELRKLAKLFEINGIPMVPYKGLVLTQQVYGNLALRPILDIDLLILKEDFQRVKKLLLTERYQPLHHVSSAEEEFRLFSACEYEFVTPSSRHVVEIHWGVWEESVFSVQAVSGVLQRSHSSSFLGLSVLTLSPEDALVFACVHLAKHRWRELRLICDIAELIRVHPQMDWIRLLEIAENTHNKRLLYLGILLAHDVLGAAVPKGVTTPIAADALLIQFAQNAEKALFQEDEDPGRGALYDTICLRDRFRDKIRTALWFALTPSVEDYEWLPLPPRLIKLYYFLRPWRQLIDYGLARVRSCFRQA